MLVCGTKAGCAIPHGNALVRNAEFASAIYVLVGRAYNEAPQIFLSAK